MIPSSEKNSVKGYHESLKIGLYPKEPTQLLK